MNPQNKTMKNPTSPLKRPILFLLTLLCAVVASLQNIHAATITVTNTNDGGPGSLRQALTDAIADDTINFSVSGTILLASTLPDINITLTIDATGQNITISGNNSVQVMRVNTGATLTLEGLTIVHGNGVSGAAAIENVGTLTVTNSTFSGNVGGNPGGGGIYNAVNRTLNLNTSILGNNSASIGPDIFGTVLSGDYNLVKNTSGSTLSGTHNITGVDPLLGPLQPNGGPTFTFSLLGGSPAIDAGTDLTALNGAIDDMTTGVTVTDATGIVAGVGFAIQIDSEQMIVDAKSANTLTVMRGANSTTPTAHSNGAAVNPAFDQRDSGFARKVGSAVDIGAFEVQPPIQDFSISTSPSSKTVVQGGSTSYIVNTSYTSGSPQTIFLQLSGLPAGASGSFNPNSVTSGASSTLNINAGTAAPGTYAITVTGTGNVTHSSSAQLIVIPAVTPTPTPTATSTPTPTPTPTPAYAAQIQQPIDLDGTSVFNVHRGVVPARFTLTLNGVATCALPPATIAVTRTAGGTIGPVDESDYNGPADNGSNFRIDSCQYVYNLSASAMGVGTYRVDIIINGQVVGSATFALR